MVENCFHFLNYLKENTLKLKIKIYYLFAFHLLDETYFMFYFYFL